MSAFAVRQTWAVVRPRRHLNRQGVVNPTWDTKHPAARVAGVELTRHTHSGRADAETAGAA